MESSPPHEDLSVGQGAQPSDSDEEYDPSPDVQIVSHIVQAPSTTSPGSQVSTANVTSSTVLLPSMISSHSIPDITASDNPPHTSPVSLNQRASFSSAEQQVVSNGVKGPGDPAKSVGTEGGEMTYPSADNGILRESNSPIGMGHHSLSQIPVTRLSTDDVPIQNAAQDQISLAAVQNGPANTVPNLAAVIPDTGAASYENETAQPPQTLPLPKSEIPESSAPESIPATSSGPKVRLPHDKIGILEDRVKVDPRGDIDAWKTLIHEHKKRSKIDDARDVYERFLTVFPSAAEQWIAYAQMENEAQNRSLVEMIFHRKLLQIPNVQFWLLYLGHIRRHNNLTTDATGSARKTINEAYDLALREIGIDKDSGAIWQDYVQFLRSWPGTIGGSNWQDQQKMDLLRKTFQRAICVPTQAVNLLWKEYDTFEMGLNKVTGRKFLQDQSPAYMSARSSSTKLQNMTRELRRATLPVLPPAPGFEGHDEYMQQLSIWKEWIEWEKTDPLVLKQEDPASYRHRITFVYRQAVMAMRFWPELWFDAADFCFENNLDNEGNNFLTQGIEANPESCLLAFKRADRLELTTSNEEGDEGAIRRGAVVREPYEKLLDALYALITKAKTREEHELARIEAQHAYDPTGQVNGVKVRDDDEDMGDEGEAETEEQRKNKQIETVKKVNTMQVHMLSKTISHTWIAVMRAMRRIQGKGKPNDALGGSRKAFTDARKRGRITSDVYVANALIEYHCYDPEATKKIFERGLKLFPEDEGFALEYIKHLIAINDLTNARVVFETVVSKLAQNPDNIARTKPIYAFFYDFEARYGELSQITKLEKRMSDHFPEDPKLSLFARRFVQNTFDPCAVQLIISPGTQARPRVLPSIETPPSVHTDLPGQYLQPINSPKRSLPEDSDPDGGRPRKYARGESPLKGAAGRRLDQQKRRQPNETPNDHSAVAHPPPPPLLPRDVLFLLSIIPKAETYHATRFKPEEMVRLIRDTNIPNSSTQFRPPGGIAMPPIHQMQTQHMPHLPAISLGQYNGSYSFNR